MSTSGLPDTALQRRAWAEISAEALVSNITLLTQRFAPARVMAVVKADAYGHGMALVAPLAANAGLCDFGVATVEEGVALRTLLPQANIFVIALTLPSDAEALVAHRLVPFISTRQMGAALAQAARMQGIAAEAHLEVDTGIGRAGVLPSELLELFGALREMKGLKVAGLITHFACADEDSADASAQNTLFLQSLSQLSLEEDSLLIHASNSPGALVVPESGYQMVRPGLLLYGIEPALGMFSDSLLPLQPVLTLKARVLLCRRLPEGTSLSYGRTYTVPPGGGVYATLGIGYGDGLPRELSNRGHVVLQGQAASICGRVCMDQIVVDVTFIPNVLEGDVATIIGQDGPERITAGQLAEQIDTTPHQITTCLTSRIPRFLK